jgi:hypothetical protein
MRITGISWLIYIVCTNPLDLVRYEFHHSSSFLPVLWFLMTKTHRCLCRRASRGLVKGGGGGFQGLVRGQILLEEEAFAYCTMAESGRFSRFMWLSFVPSPLFRRKPCSRTILCCLGGWGTRTPPPCRGRGRRTGNHENVLKLSIKRKTMGQRYLNEIFLFQKR